MAAAHPNSFKARKSLKVGAKDYTYWSLKAVEKEVGDLSRLPFSLRVLMENLVRNEDGTVHLLMLRPTRLVPRAIQSRAREPPIM